MKRQIDRFKLIEALGEGGQGAVFRAEEALAPGITRNVAFKLLPAITARDKSSENRFAAELKALAVLSGHPHIVSLLAAGVADNMPWIATEYLPQSLLEAMGESPADSAEVAKLIRHLARALVALHKLEPPLLHNDLKPANILIDSGGNYRLGDFGCACAEGTERTRVVATVRYAAPELLSRDFGATGAHTDLYALGHIAYELALGQKLYRKQFPSVYDEHDPSKDAPPARWMAWHCSLGTVPAPVHEARPGFPAELADLIARLMTKDPAKRCGSAQAVLEELKNPVAAEAPLLLDEAPAGRAAPLPAASRAAPGAAVPAVPRARFVPSQARPAATAPVAAGAPAGGARYWVKLRGQVSGPFDLATLQRQAKAGRISRLHQVSVDKTNWQSASTVEGLF